MDTESDASDYLIQIEHNPGVNDDEMVEYEDDYGEEIEKIITSSDVSNV